MNAGLRGQATEALPARRDRNVWPIVADQWSRILDELVGHVRVIADACTKAAVHEKSHAVECPYCREEIRTTEDHVLWCDIPAALAEPLANPDTKWPVMRYGVAINEEWAKALTRKDSKS